MDERIKGMYFFVILKWQILSIGDAVSYHRGNKKCFAYVMRLLSCDQKVTAFFLDRLSADFRKGSARGKLFMGKESRRTFPHHFGPYAKRLLEQHVIDGNLHITEVGHIVDECCRIAGLEESLIRKCLREVFEGAISRVFVEDSDDEILEEALRQLGNKH